MAVDPNDQQPEVHSVDSLGKLIEIVTRLSNGGEHILWYRGQRDSRWNVETSLHRIYSASDERNFTNRFRSRAAIRYANSPTYDDHAGWLSLMQHYGLPTRLLDWTRSPLIAAYFALEHLFTGASDTSPESEAAIWILWPHALNKAMDETDVTPSVHSTDCRRILAPAFTHKAEEPGIIKAVMASETDLRIFVQQGCFTIHSNRTPIDLLPNRAEFLQVLTIPSTRLKSFRRELHACGFRQGDIFPDLGHLASELKHDHQPFWAGP
jgi:hypothetical protein